MAGVLLTGGHSTAVLAASATRTMGLYNGESVELGTESQSSVPYRSAGVLSKLRILVTAYDRGNGTFKSRKGGVDGNLLINTINAAGEFVDSTNTDTVTAGDLWCSMIITGAGGTTCVWRATSCMFSATTDTVTPFCNTAGTTYTNNNQTLYQTLGSTSATTTSTTVANAQTKMKTAGVLKNLSVNVITNTRTTTTRVRTDIGGAAGNMFFDVLTTSVGVKEDTTNTETIAVDTLVALAIVFGADAANFRMRTFKTEFATTNSCSELIGGRVDGTTITAATTYYASVGGFVSSALEATENDAKFTSGAVFTASKLRCYISTNGVTGASTLRLRADNANLNQVVSITGSTANTWFEDTTNTDSITAAQKLNYSLVGGTGGTTQLLHTIAMLANYTTPATLRQRLMGYFQAVNRASTF